MAINNDFVVKSGLVVKANTTIPETGSLLTSSIVRTIAKPALDLNFTKPGPIDSRITFSRNSVASYVNSSGLIAYANVNQPRIDYDPVTKACKGLLSEDYRVNLITYSQDASNNQYTQNVSISTDQIIAPDGTLTGDKITATATGGSNDCHIQKTATVAADTNIYTMSVFLKAGNTTYSTINLQLAGGTYQQSIVSINWTTNTLYGTSGGVSTLTAYANGWYRLTLTLTNNGTNTAVYPRVYVRDQGTANVAGDYVYAWGWQVEQAYFASSYIPTASASAARSNAICTLQGQNFNNWFNPNQGSFYLECDNTFDASQTSYPRVLMFSDANFSQNNTIQCLYYTASSGIQVAVWKSGSFLNATNASSTSGRLVKLSFSYNQTTIIGSFNGGVSSSYGITGLPLLDRVGLGAQANGNGGMFGHIKRFTYWPQQLTNTQLQALTVS